MARGTLIYDNTGRVWDIFAGLETVPAGLQGVVADIPDNYSSVYVEVATGTPVWTVRPDAEAEITNLQEALIDLEARVEELEGN